MASITIIYFIIIHANAFNIDNTYLHMYYLQVWHCHTLYTRLNLDNMISNKEYISNLLLAFKYQINHTIPPHQYKSLAGSLIEAFIILMC